MRMKTKLIALATTAILSVVAINNKIFKNAEKKLIPVKKKSKTSSHIYNWKFGQINYKTIGEGAPVLMIHSLLPGTNESEWENNIEELSKNNKLYLINLLGYGDSQRACITYSSYMFVCLINDFISEVIKEPAIVIASNTSSAIAEMSYIFNPSNFSKICLICPPVVPKKTPVSLQLLNKIPLDFPILGDLIFNFYNSKKKLANLLKTKAYSDESFVTKDKIDSLYAYSHKEKGNNRHLFSAFITNRFEIGIETSLPETDIPVLIIYSTDFINNSEINLTETIKKLNSSAKVEILKGKSYPQEEDFENFNRICSEFIK